MHVGTQSPFLSYSCEEMANTLANEICHSKGDAEWARAHRTHTSFVYSNISRAVYLRVLVSLADDVCHSKNSNIKRRAAAEKGEIFFEILIGFMRQSLPHITLVSMQRLMALF